MILLANPLWQPLRTPAIVKTKVVLACKKGRCNSMSLKPETISPVPELTARVAGVAFPKGNTFIKMRDELGSLFTDEMFAPLFLAGPGSLTLSPGNYYAI